MKNYNEMANDVLHRIEEHNVIKQKRQKTIKRVVVPICSLCVAIILGVGLWQGDVFKVEPDLPPIDIVDTPTSEETVTSEIPSTSVSETTSEPVISEQIKPQSSQAVTPQPQKTIINVDPETAKMGFYATNGIDDSKIEKEYVTDKNSKIEKYTKSNVQNKTFNILGVEYANLEYLESRKRVYKGKEYDVFQGADIKIHILPNGDIIYFYAQNPKRFFWGEDGHSEELAKKYLEKIAPNYEYDAVKLTKIDSIDWYEYIFFKTIDGVRTSDSISILMNSYGDLRSYMITDVGKYDDIEIKNLNINDFEKRIEDYATNAYGDALIDCGINDDGPYLSIFTDNKLELTIPIWVKFKSSDSNEYKTGEYVVFELN